MKVVIAKANQIHCYICPFEHATLAIATVSWGEYNLIQMVDYYADLLFWSGTWPLGNKSKIKTKIQHDSESKVFRSLQRSNWEERYLLSLHH